MSTDGQGTKWHRNIAENFNRPSMAHERYRRTTDRQMTDVWQIQRLTARRVQFLLLAFLLSQLTSQNTNLSPQLTRQEHVSFCTSHALLHCIACTTYVDAVYCYRPSSVVCRLVGLSVCHTSEPCKNSWSNRDAIWVEDSGGPREPCTRLRSRSPIGSGNFEEEGVAHCKV